MLDIDRIRKAPGEVRAGLEARGASGALVDQVLDIDRRRRDAQARADALKAERNQVGPEIAKLKRSGEDASELLAKASALAKEIKALEAVQSEAEQALEALLLALPNLASPDVPVGADESANEVVRVCGEPPVPAQGALDAHTFLEERGWVDLARGAKLAGSGFPLYTGIGARVERTLLQWFLDVNTREHGYTEMMTPFVANTDTLRGTGQLPKFEDDLYRLRDDDLYLIPTAEVTLTNIYRGEILDASELPIRLTGYSPCFRREAGAAGKQTRGILRVHQFNKVELVNITTAEQSEAAHEAMVEAAGAFLDRLGLHWRVVLLSSGDMGFSAAKTYDLEVWAPVSKRWLECSSISNCRDFQARRMRLRYRDADGKIHYCHTLNGSGLATPRVMIALVETHQDDVLAVVEQVCLGAGSGALGS